MPRWTLDVTGFSVYSDDIGATLDEVATATTLTADHSLLLVNALNGNVIITLPAVADHISRTYTVKKIDISNHTVTIEPNRTEQLEWEDNLRLGLQGDVVSFTGIDATLNWLITGGRKVKMEDILKDIEDVLRSSLNRQDKSLVILGKLEKHIDETNTVVVDEDEVVEEINETMPDIED